jgi:hypothetical protein
MNMTDLDVLERFHCLFGGNLNGPYQKQHDGTKPIWAWSATGFEPTQALLAMFWPWLGERRRAKAAEDLLRYRQLVREREAKPRLPRTCRYRNHLITDPSQEGSGNQCLACRREIRREAKLRATS